jgi:hypothetical protein
LHERNSLRPNLFPDASTLAVNIPAGHGWGNYQAYPIDSPKILVNRLEPIRGLWLAGLERQDRPLIGGTLPGSCAANKAKLQLAVVYIQARADYLSPQRRTGPSPSPRVEERMRAEAEALVEAIKQSMGLLRRHL